MKRSIRSLSAIVFLMLIASPIWSEPVCLPDTEVRRISSEANGIDYKLYVSLPEDYDESEERYRVLYLLDADYSFAIARNVVEHLVQRNDLEPLILIGIAYDGPLRYRLNRTRDYTPTHTLEGGYGPEYQKVSGGGPKFLQFLETELIPMIDREYRTIEGDRGLTGHSYGGLFSSWVFVTRPELFTRYIIVSPSLWYDDEMMFALEQAREEAEPDRDGTRRRIYLGVGADENRRMPIVLLRFENELKNRGDEQLKIRAEVMDGENHNTVFPTAFSRGLRWTFEGR